MLGRGWTWTREFLEEPVQLSRFFLLLRVYPLLHTLIFFSLTILYEFSIHAIFIFILRSISSLVPNRSPALLFRFILYLPPHFTLPSFSSNSTPFMRVAVVGSGVAGLSATWVSSRKRF